MMKRMGIVVLLLTVTAWGQQSQHQRQHQQQNVGNTVTNSHNNTAVGGVGGSSSLSSSYSEPRQVPMGYAPEAIPTAPCRVGKSVGGSSPYFGVALGGSSDDKECEKRVAAAAFADIGNRVAAARILCTLKAAKDAGLSPEDCMLTAPIGAEIGRDHNEMWVAPVPDIPALPAAYDRIVVPGPIISVGVPVTVPTGVIASVRKPVVRRSVHTCPVGGGK